MRLRLLTSFSIAAVLIACIASRAPADIVRLRNGGLLRGRVAIDDRGADDRQLTITTLSGAVVVIDRRHVDSVTRRPVAREEYEVRAALAENSIDAQWTLAEWCREHNFDAARETHLRRILALDPDNELAHRGLGHIRRNGQWTTHAELMRERGYVKHRGRYVTPQELELMQKREAEDAAEKAWYKKVRKWHSWLTGRSAELQRRAVGELQQANDPGAVPALSRLFSDESDPQLRRIYIQTLKQIPSESAVAALVNQSLRDSDYRLRYEASDAITPDEYEVAMRYYVQALDSAYNVAVTRAAAALEEIGDERVVPALIDALITAHKYRIRVPDNSGIYSFGTDGSFGNANQIALPPEIELQLRTGQLPYGVEILPPLDVHRRTRLVTIERAHKNSQVLSALANLTGENFGYDKRAWGLWWANHKNSAINAPALP